MTTWKNTMEVLEEIDPAFVQSIEHVLETGDQRLVELMTMFANVQPPYHEHHGYRQALTAFAVDVAIVVQAAFAVGSRGVRAALEEEVGLNRLTSEQYGVVFSHLARDSRFQKVVMNIIHQQLLELYRS